MFGRIMDIENIRKICLSKKGVTESFPFDETTLVFKVMNKIFCLLNLDYPHTINLKCDPERAVMLREEYEDIIPGWHMNKKHWNTLQLTGTLKNSLVEELIEHSYNLVAAKLNKTDKEELKKLTRICH